MILVDTSAWIAHFRRAGGFVLEDWAPMEEIVTCLPVVQEVLQGIDDDHAFRVVSESMAALPIVESPLSDGVVRDAVGLYRATRRGGITVRSSVDCLIAACALRHDLEVLHDDRDFDRLAKVSTLRARNLSKRA